MSTPKQRRFLKTSIGNKSLRLEIADARHRCLVEWYDKPHNGPTQWILLQADAAVMSLNKRFANGQPQPQAIGWAEFRYPIKFIEDPAQVFRRDTHAPIGNQNLELVIDDVARTSTG